MSKKYIIFKSDLNEFLNELNKTMTKTKTFYNVITKEYKKDNDKIIVIVG